MDISSTRSRIAIILPLMLGTLMSGIDSSIVNVSLPTMRNQFHCGLDDIEWVITAYMLGFCIFIPLTNWLKQHIGFYKLYLGSVFVFTVGSLMCGLSTSLTMLIISRAIQAFGGGAITPTAMAILTSVFPKNERGSMMGWWSLGSITGPAIGPTLGGLLTEYFGWPSIFMVNIPIGIITIIIAAISLRFLQDQQKLKTNSFNTLEFGLFTLFIVLLQLAIAKLARAGINSPMVIGSFVLSIVALWIFIRSSRNNRNPLFDLSVFQQGDFVKCMLITLVRSIALYSGLFLLPFLLQGLLGYSEIESGLFILPNSVMMAILTPIAGSWSDKHGPKQIVVIGLILVSASMFMFSQVDSRIAWYVLLAMSIRGLGMGALVSPITSTAMNSVNSDLATDASSLYSLTQQLGGSTGIALAGLIHQYLYEHYLNGKHFAQAVAEHYAIEDAFLISSFLALLALIPALKLPVIVPDKKNELVHTEV